MRTLVAALFVAAIIVLTAATARAANTTISAGGTLKLTADLTLSGADVLEISGTADKPCTLEGNDFAIKAEKGWTGRIKVTWCTFKKLGKEQPVIRTPPPRDNPYPGFKIEAPDAPAVDVAVEGSGDVTFDHCTFDECNAVHVTANGQASVSILHCTVLENARTPASEQPSTSRPAFEIRGDSSAKKFFQGNRTFKGESVLRSPNFMIGGDRDEDSNFLVGVRARMDAGGAGTVVRGNYLHVNILGSPKYAYWSQVSTFTSGPGVLVEHNIIRDGEWILQFVEGEFRYNVICDHYDHNFLRNASVGSFHHNLFLATKPHHGKGEENGGIVIGWAKEGQKGIEIYNNTFDGYDIYESPGINMGKDELVKSLRNNVFCRFKLTPKLVSRPNAIIFGPGSEAMLYADYNCFFNPLASVKTIYSAAVKGKTLRKEDGFAKHDLPVGGEVDAQVDPKFKGPFPKEFPFNDEDIFAGKVTMSQMLSYFRDIYTPADGSPLIDAGDPADGPGTDIGAIGAGKPDKNDQFGKWGKK